MFAQNVTMNWAEIVDYVTSLLPDERLALFKELKVSNLEELRMLVHPYEYELMNITEYWANKHLQVIVPPILIVIGTIGNILSFIILLRKPMIRVSTYVFLAVLALVDTVFLYLGLFRIWLRDLTGIHPLDHNDIACKVLTFFGFVSSDFAVWLIVAVTVERYIAVCHPLKASRMCNTRRALSVIILILLIIMGINIHFLWTVSIKYFDELGENVSRCDGAPIWPWIDGVIYSFLPFLVITVLNILIIRQVVVARRTRVLMAGQREGPTTPDSGYKITVMLLTISFAFLITTLPSSVCMIIGALMKHQTDPVDISRYVLAQTITEHLMYVNHSMNFFLYCATGQKFRFELFRLARSCTGQRVPLRGYMSENTGTTINNGTMRETRTEMYDYKKQAAQALLHGRKC